MLESIRAWLKNSANLNHSGGPIIKGLWRIRCMFQPTLIERKFNYHILVAQTSGQGSCYYESPELTDKALLNELGKEYNGQPTGNQNIDIALLDSVAISLNIPPDFSCELSGSNSSKAIKRANLLVEEVIKLVNGIQAKRKVRVCNIGVVSLLIHTLLKSGFEVTASDKDKNLIGRTLFEQVKIMPASETLRLIAKSDVALVTGMTLSTQTLSNIVEVAKQNNTKLVLFAETGAGFAPFYVRNGINIAISEPFPFYTFDGLTHINIYRQKK